MTQEAHFGRRWTYRYSVAGAEVHVEDLADNEEALALGVRLRAERHLDGDLVIERQTSQGWSPVGVQGRTQGSDG